MQWRRMRDKIFCLIAKNETSKWAPCVSIRINKWEFQGSYPTSEPATVGGVLK